jgi:hypothetical protein
VFNREWTVGKVEASLGGDRCHHFSPRLAASVVTGRQGHLVGRVTVS